MRCTKFIQGTGVVSIISFDVIILRSMGSSTQVYAYKKNKLLKSQFILADAEKPLGSSVSYYQARGHQYWANSKAW